jgi:hypothetical protein
VRVTDNLSTVDTWSSSLQLKEIEKLFYHQMSNENPKRRMKIPEVVSKSQMPIENPKCRLKSQM